MALHELSEVLQMHRQRHRELVGRCEVLDANMSRDADWLRSCPAVQDGREPGIVELRWAANMGYEWNGSRFEPSNLTRVKREEILQEFRGA